MSKSFYRRDRPSTKRIILPSGRTAYAEKVGKSWQGWIKDHDHTIIEEKRLNDLIAELEGQDWYLSNADEDVDSAMEDCF